jgi:thymidylate synthase (FAD)
MEQKAEKLKRRSVAELDAILGDAFKVLDDGFIRVIDYMGSDEAIVQAARVSYGDGTTKVHQDRGLIRYLMRHRHSTPFEMCEIKFHLRVPMDAWRQWIRHRTANINEYSTRYSIAIDAAQATKSNEWRLQAKSNRQGSEGVLEKEKGEELSRKEKELQNLARDLYNERLELGVAREQARKELPLSTYTEAYWKIDLHNLLHFLALRMDEHAQYEIRMYAKTIGEQIVSRWCPLAWEAFMDYRVNAETLSNLETQIISRIAAKDNEGAVKLATEFGWISYREDGSLKGHLERAETEATLKKLGLPIPWSFQHPISNTQIQFPRVRQPISLFFPWTLDIQFLLLFS